jgi:hypothetical protein
VHLLYPEKLSIREETGLADHDPETKIPYLAFQTEPAQTQKFLIAIVPKRLGEAPPSLDLLIGPLWLGVRIRGKDRVSDVYLNLQADGRRMDLNSHNTIAGWETDAYLFAWTRPVSLPEQANSAHRFFIAYGSYLRRDGRVYLDSLTKADLVWMPGHDRPAGIQGQKTRRVAII